MRFDSRTPDPRAQLTHGRAEDETVAGSKRPGHGLAAYIDSPNVPDKNYRTALTRHIAVTCENASLCQESWNHGLRPVQAGRTSELALIVHGS